MSLIRKFDLKNAKTAGVDVLCVTAGFVGAYKVAQLVNKNSLLVNAGITAAGIAVATMSANPLIQAVGGGIAVYGGIRTVNNLAADVLALHGFGEAPPTPTNPIPAGIRSFLQTSFPTLGEADENVAAAIDFRLNEPATEVRAINGFNPFTMSGDEEAIAGQAFMMS